MGIQQLLRFLFYGSIISDAWFARIHLAGGILFLLQANFKCWAEIFYAMDLTSAWTIFTPRILILKKNLF